MDILTKEDLAYLIGKVMGDGHLDKNFTIKLIGQKEDLMVIRDYFKKGLKFDLKIYKKQGYGNSYYMNISNKLGKLIFNLGAPVGKKTEISFFVPDWILNGSKQVKRSFLQAILEDELTTIKIEKKTHANRPQFKMSKIRPLLEEHRRFMSQIKDLIECFGIDCGKISDPKQKEKQSSWDLYFPIQRNKKNIIKFEKEIGFRFNQDKIKKLKSCVTILESSIKAKPL
ncbi:MAG: hypothetical protein ABIJ18_02285 [archaeon]